MATITFSALLIQILKASDMGLRSVYSALQEKDIKISYPALAAYRAFTSVPTLEKARAILEVFNYPIEEQDLQDLLEYSRFELKNMRNDRKRQITQGIRISPKNISKDMEIFELEEILNERTVELCGEDATLNAYITELIRQDLIQSGYISDDRKESA